MSNRLSLIMATYGRCDDVDRLFDSLASQDDRRFEVIVVDQNSDDRLLGAIERAVARGLAVQHLRCAEPNLSAARNAGLQCASGEVVAFPDDDCWYEPDVVGRVLRAFDSHPEWDGVVARWVEQSAGRVVATEGQTLQYSEWRNFRGRDASSITLFFRSEVFARVGGFEPALGVGQWFGSGEETDFVLRALAAEAAIAFLPLACVHHAFGVARQQSLGSAWRGARARARGTGALYARHRMSAWVVLRGVCAPLVKPWLRPKPLRGALLGLAQSLGALEGFLSWRWSRGAG